MRGHYCEREEGNKIRFIEVHICEYDFHQIERLKEMEILEDSKIYEYLSLIQGSIPMNTQYLYKLQTYFSVKGLDDLWEFNNYISDYQEFGFYNIEFLLTFCNTQWKINKEDFMPLNETSIPS